MRRLLILALLASVTFAAYPNLQLWYRAQDTTGTTTTIDCSGNGRNGTINGSKVCATARSQQALYFDGDDYVATPSFGLSGTVVWLSTWVRCKFNATVEQHFLSSGLTFQTYRSPNTNDFAFYHAPGVDGDNTITDFFASPFNDVWVHLMTVVDYTGKKLYVYRNAVPYSPQTIAGGALTFPSVSRVWYLGYYGSGAYFLTQGYLQDVKFGTLATMPPLAVVDASAKRLAAGLMPCW